jgi:hypothetical protein
VLPLPSSLSHPPYSVICKKGQFHSSKLPEDRQLSWAEAVPQPSSQLARGKLSNLGWDRLGHFDVACVIVYSGRESTAERLGVTSRARVSVRS